MYANLMGAAGFKSERNRQIRVHLASIGYPILGDPLYAPDQTTYQRMYLHAFQVRFTKPLSDTTLTVTSPLPF